MWSVLIVANGLVEGPVWALDRRLCLDLAMSDQGDNREVRPTAFTVKQHFKDMRGDNML